MKIRTLESLDGPRICTMFEKQGIDYALPDIRKLVSAQVIESEGTVVQAILARPTTELYFLQDADWRTPAWRLEALRKIHESVRCELVMKGFEDVHAFLDPSLAKTFGKRLMEDFGWTHPLWYPLTRSTAPRE